MRYLKSLIIAAFVFAFAAGTVFAEDDALEIHGGGRIGVVVNSKGGSETGPVGGGNALGTMPNYGESNYFALWLSKKTTADGGSWAKVTLGLDHHDGNANGDFEDKTLRLRGFNVEFGGLDFMPAGSTLWAGLRGYGDGWNGMQDHSFINMAGIGIGVSNLGGIFSLAYMGYDHQYDTAQYLDLGERTTHHFIASVNTPMISVYAAMGYSPKHDAIDDAYTSMYGGAIYHAPVMGINVGLAVSTNGYAAQIYGNDYDTMFKPHGDIAPFADANSADNKLLGVRLLVWTVTDLAEGLYIAPSVRYDMLQVGEDAAYYSGAALGTENTINRIDIAIRLSKNLTNNIAIVPNLGYEKLWDGEEVNGPDGKQTIQGTLGFEIGLDTGFWAGQKIQVYATYTSVDDDHEFVGGAYDGETSSLVFGTLVTFGF